MIEISSTRLVRHLSLLLSAIVLAGCASSNTPSDGLRVIRDQTALNANMVDLAVFIPSSPKPAPVVVMIVDYGQDASLYEGWARAIARQGYVVALPTLPEWRSDYPYSIAINQLLNQMTASRTYDPHADFKRVGLLSFGRAAGGTMLVQEKPRARAWIAINPAEFVDETRRVAKSSGCSAFALRTAKDKAPGAHLPAYVHDVRLEMTLADMDSSDLKWPTGPQTSLSATSQPKREVMLKYLTAALGVGLTDSASSSDVLRAAQTDPAVKDCLYRSGK